MAFQYSESAAPDRSWVPQEWSTVLEYTNL
jgi:hypothetical protein